MSVSKSDVLAYLIKMAMEGKVLYYAELYNHFKIRTGPSNDTNPIPQYLGQFMSDNSRLNEPLLPSIVVGKEKDQRRALLIPNDKYFESLARIRKVPIPTSKAEKRRLHQAERDAVFARFSQTGKMADEGE